MAASRLSGLHPSLTADVQSPATSWRRRSLPAPGGARLPRKRWTRPSTPSLVGVGSDNDDDDGDDDDDDNDDDYGDGYLMEKESSSSRWSKAIKEEVDKTKHTVTGRCW